MGVKVRTSEIIRLIIYYLLVISCCDIELITCDIHQMIQRHNSNIVSNNNSSNSSSSSIDGIDLKFNLNATELEQHIMNGLNMKRKPDVNLVSVLHQL